MPPVMTGTVACSRQSCAGPPAAGDDHVHIAVETQQLRDEGAVRAGDELDGVHREPGLLQRLPDDTYEGLAAAQRVVAAAQDDGVPGLDAEHGDVDGDVRARLVDDAEHADGDAAPAEAQAVGQEAPVDLGAHGVGQVGHLAGVRSQRPYTASLSMSRSTRASPRPRARPSATSSAFSATMTEMDLDRRQWPPAPCSSLPWSVWRAAGWLPWPPAPWPPGRRFVPSPA